MAHNQSPAESLVVAAGVAATYPLDNDIRGTTTAASSSVLSTNIILESMTCLVIAGAGDIVISGHTPAATNTFTVTTTAACIPGTVLRFGAQGVLLNGKGMKINTAASTGTWLYSFRRA